MFETILVRDGAPLALERHLDRLAASLLDLGLPRAPDDVAARVRAAAREAGEARVRIVARGGHVDVETAPLPEAGDEVHLRSVAVPGGLGAHKWRDRRLLDALSAAVAPAVPVLVDLDGHVLETSRASVFAVDDAGRLVTPPLDGRILPGVTRARAIEAARSAGLEVVERPLALDELCTAREAFLTGALRLIEPVATCDGRPLRQKYVVSGPMVQRIIRLG